MTETLVRPRTLMLNVTEEHIGDGVEGDEDKCAVALAFRDAGYPGVSVGDTWIHAPTCDFFSVAVGHEHTCIRTPQAVRQWIARFDDCDETLQTEEFVLTLPDDWP